MDSDHEEPCDWLPETTVMPQPDGTYSFTAVCRQHGSRLDSNGIPYHRALVDGVTWAQLQQIGLVPMQPPHRWSAWRAARRAADPDLKTDGSHRHEREVAA
jgi:hypothetical protein